jgi:hypothetical protein
VVDYLTFEEMQMALRNALVEHSRRYPEMRQSSNPWLSLSGNGYHIFANAVIDLWLSRRIDGVDTSADNRISVDRGALQMALNVLRRAGKNEVADALAESTDGVQEDQRG